MNVNQTDSGSPDSGDFRELFDKVMGIRHPIVGVDFAAIPGASAGTNSQPRELRSVGDYADEVVQLMQREPLARLAAGVDVLDPNIPGSVYEIGSDIFNDAASAMFWIRQLAEKTWVTKQTLLDVANVVIAHRAQFLKDARRTEAADT